MSDTTHSKLPVMFLVKGDPGSCTDCSNLHTKCDPMIHYPQLCPLWDNEAIKAPLDWCHSLPLLLRVDSRLKHRVGHSPTQKLLKQKANKHWHVDYENSGTSARSKWKLHWRKTSLNHWRKMCDRKINPTSREYFQPTVTHGITRKLHGARCTTERNPCPTKERAFHATCCHTAHTDTAKKPKTTHFLCVRKFRTKQNQ